LLGFDGKMTGADRAQQEKMIAKVPNPGSPSIGVLAQARSLLQAGQGARWALADQIVVSGSNFLSNILLARILGIEEFGRYVLAWTIVLFVQGLQYSAVSSTMLSVGPKQDAEAARSYFGSIFVHQAIFGAVSAALTLLGAYVGAAAFPALRLDTIALPLAVAVLSSQTQDFLRRYFFSVHRLKISFSIDAIRYIGQNIAILALLSWFPANSTTALWLISVAAAVGSFATLPYIPPLKYSLRAILAAGLHGWHFSKWLVASTLLGFVSTNLFTFAAGIFLGAAAVGAMRAAFTIVSIANVVIEACVNTVPVGASRALMSSGRRGLIAYLKTVAIYGTAAISFLMGVVVIAPKFWLHLFFGPEFESYSNLVPWYAGVEVLIFLGLVIGTWYRTLENTRFIFYSNVFSVILLVVIAYPLIVNFGVTGAVAGLLIGQFALQVFMLIGARLVDLATYSSARS
jgi:O-antigen/teichoic acid export membrane protein